MSAHVERMKIEHKELTAKLTALNAFINGSEEFKNLCDLDQAIMIEQVGFMEGYAQTLNSRILASN